MMLLGGAVGLFMVFGFVAGLGLIALGLAIYPPSVLFLLGLIALGWWQWKVAKRIAAQKTTIVFASEPLKPANIRHKHTSAPRSVLDGFDDPSLPSSLD